MRKKHVVFKEVIKVNFETGEISTENLYLKATDLVDDINGKTFYNLAMALKKKMAESELCQESFLKYGYHDGLQETI